MAKTKFAMVLAAILTLSGCTQVNWLLEAFPTYPYVVAYIATFTWGLTWIGLLVTCVYVVNQRWGLNKEPFNLNWAVMVAVSGILSYGFSYTLPGWALIIPLALAMGAGYHSLYRFQLMGALPQFLLRRLGWETALPELKVKGFDLNNLLSKVNIPLLRTKTPPSVQAPRCTVCGKPFRPGARFCCGKPVGQTNADPVPHESNPPPQGHTQCAHCGKPFRPGARFCCGKPIGQTNEEPKPTETRPPPKGYGFL